MAAWSGTSPRSVASSPTTEHSVAVTSHVSGVNLSASYYRRVAEDISDSPLTSGWELVKGCVYVVVGVAYCLVFLVLARQNQDPARPSFSVPLVPLVPCLSIFMNIYLMLNLDVSTWVRFLVWMVLGLGVYFTYGLQHSKLSKLKTV